MRMWWKRVLRGLWRCAQWVLAIGASLLPLVALDLFSDKVRARTLWRRLRWHAADLRDWLHVLPDRMRALCMYGLGLSEYRWRQLRRRYQTGEYEVGGT